MRWTGMFFIIPGAKERLAGAEEIWVWILVQHSGSSFLSKKTKTHACTILCIDTGHHFVIIMLVYNFFKRFCYPSCTELDIVLDLETRTNVHTISTSVRR